MIDLVGVAEIAQSLEVTKATVSTWQSGARATAAASRDACVRPYLARRGRDQVGKLDGEAARWSDVARSVLKICAARSPT